MSRILVVDDSRVDLELVAALLSDVGHACVRATNGREALDLVQTEAPDLIVTDLQMPEMGGLELVRAVHARYPKVPVVLMTAHGSEEIAAAALRAGAASYVPKRNLARDLASTIERVLGVAPSDGDRGDPSLWLAKADYRYELDNRCDWLRPLVAHFQEELARRGFRDDTELMQVGMALHEALTNAAHHGNLELDSSLRENGIEAYLALMQERLVQEPYAGRRVHVAATFTPAEAAFVIRDEGKGFDPGTVPDCCDPKNLARLSGRGLMLMRTFMDDVRHNDRGNEVTLVKRRKA
ncbi:MAG TPA: response regulator [Planctomycetota bacterium]|nr:response regulator [Planctomycetota bacterium]